MTAPRTTPNPATETRPQRSSQKVARKRPLAWLPWALLGGLAALLALVFLVINAVDDDGPDGPAGDRLGQVNSNGSGINGQNGNGQIAGTETQPNTAQQGGQPNTAQQGGQPNTAQQGGQSGAAAPGSAAGAGAAALRVGDQDLLGMAGGSLTGNLNQPVTGTAKVESVVSDEGFWVGSSKTQRVFVYLTPQARKANGESPFQVRTGQSIQLSGQLVPAAANPAPLRDVTNGEGLGQIRQQGAYVNAQNIQLAD